MTTRTPPPAEMLQRLYLDEQLTLAQIGDRIGYSTSGVAKLLRAAGIARRPTGGRQRNPPDPSLVADIAARYRAGESLASIAAAYRRSVWWVKWRLAAADQQTRRRGATGPLHATADQLELMKTLYLDEGRTLAAVGDAVGHSGAWVSRELKAAGVVVRNGGAPAADVDEDLVRSLYLEEQLSSTVISERLNVSQHVILTALHRLGVPLRPSGTRRLPYTCDELHRLYVDEGRTTVEIADLAGMSPSGISHALHRCGIPTRGGGPPLTIPTTELRRLYVDERIEASDIAARFGVATWAVTRRLRSDGIRRPPATPPGTRPSPPAHQLCRLYLEEGLTQAEIATRYRVPRSTVRRWLDRAGVPRRRRGGGGRTSGSQAAGLDRADLEDLYVGHEYTAAEVGRKLGASKKLVLTALHQLGIPVRPSGPRRQTQARVLLDDLYADPTISGILTHHGVPIRPDPGPLRQRWPSPEPLSASLLEELYVRIGLSAHHISLLTGHYESGVLIALQEAGIPARTDHDRSPWAQNRPRAGH